MNHCRCSFKRICDVENTQGAQGNACKYKLVNSSLQLMYQPSKSMYVRVVDASAAAIVRIPVSVNLLSEKNMAKIL